MTRLTAAQIEEIRKHLSVQQAGVVHPHPYPWLHIKRLLGHIAALESENDAFRVGALASSKAISALEKRLNLLTHPRPSSSAYYRPPNVAGMFAPNEDPRGGKTHEELKASMSPEVYDKKMEDARQLMRDFRRPGRD